MFVYGACLLVIMVAYPAIAIGLYRQSRKIRAATANSLHTVSQAVNSQARNPPNNANATGKHIKTLKLYVAILGLFLLSFLAASIVTADMKVFAYLTHLNNVGNFFIYYWRIENFRQKVKELVGNLIPSCLI